MNTGQEQIDETEADDPVPLCLNCLHAVKPLDKVCPTCGRAVGQLTPYLPWESIAWEAGIWGQMWKQVWHRGSNFAGRALRLVIIVCFAPVLLVGLIPIAWRRLRRAT